MAQYRAKYLQHNKIFVENDSFDLSFIILDQNGNIVESLTPWKFRSEITNGSQELKKRCANAGGNASQISTSGKVVTIHVSATDTDNWDGEDYEVELEMENISSGAKYTVFKKRITVLDEELDWTT